MKKIFTVILLLLTINSFAQVEREYTSLGKTQKLIFHKSEYGIIMNIFNIDYNHITCNILFGFNDNIIEFKTNCINAYNEYIKYSKIIKDNNIKSVTKVIWTQFASMKLYPKYGEVMDIEMEDYKIIANPELESTIIIIRFYNNASSEETWIGFMSPEEFKSFIDAINIEEVNKVFNLLDI